MRRSERRDQRSDIRDMMLKAVETRFGSYRARQPIEMLSDNGSPYTAKHTRIFARQLGLKPCLTAREEPPEQWHLGSLRAHAEVRLRPGHTAPQRRSRACLAPRLVRGLQHQHQHQHRHSGLNMRSPREFIAAQTATP